MIGASGISSDWIFSVMNSVYIVKGIDIFNVYFLDGLERAGAIRNVGVGELPAVMNSGTLVKEFAFKDKFK